MEAHKASLKREREQEREAVKIAKQKVAQKEAAIPKPVAKKAGATLVTADEILKNTTLRATAPASYDVHFATSQIAWCCAKELSILRSKILEMLTSCYLCS